MTRWMIPLLALLSASPGFAAVPAPNLHVGDAALLFSLPALNEEAALRAVARTHVALSDFTGIGAGFQAKAVVIHFLQRAGGESQLQALNRLQRKFGPRSVRFIAIVSGETEIASLSDWVETQKLDFPVLNDAHRIVLDRYGVRHFPMTFIVNGEGDVEAIGVPKEDLESSIDAEILALVKD